MKKRIAIAASLLLLGVAGIHLSYADTAAPSPVTHGTVILLKDGGKVMVDKNGNTYHEDGAGRRVRMRDGVSMEAADGTRYTMKNDALWRTITEKGTMANK